MLFTNRDARRIACRQLGNDITLEVTKHLLVRSAFWRELVRPHNRDAKACERTGGTRGDETRIHKRAGRMGGEGEEGKTRTRRQELHPALRPDAAKQARAGVNNALRRGSAISGHVPVRDFLSSAYKACGRGRAVWQELGRASKSLSSATLSRYPPCVPHAA